MGVNDIMKKLKKVISLTLILVMLASNLAFAENKNGESEIIELQKTTVTSINYYRNNTAGRKVTDAIYVTPGRGREVKLQRYNEETKKWQTKVTKKASSEETSKIIFQYPSEWYAQKTSKWRIYVPATETATKFISNEISVNTKRVYQNPSKYFQIQDNISFAGQGNYSLKKGTMGLKVRKVQVKLGMGTKNYAIVGPKTIEKIKAFQKKKGLPVTGVVNYTTWKAMGLSYSDWKNLGAYVSPMQVDYTSTKKDCIEAMIDRAYDYLGTDYIVGASGKPGQGVDCSGLVMQALYAAGINPLPVSVIRHSQPGYEYESRNLYKSSKFKKVAYKDRKRGDLIFYSNSNGTIIHVAIYLGNDKVIESWPNKVVVWPIKNSHRSRIAGVRRVFN